jgi:hypothetical protein
MLLRTRQVAEMLGRPQETVARHAASGRYAGAKKWGTDWTIPGEAIPTTELVLWELRRDDAGEVIVSVNTRPLGFEVTARPSDDGSIEYLGQRYAPTGVKFVEATVPMLVMEGTL